MLSKTARAEMIKEKSAVQDSCESEPCYNYPTWLALNNKQAVKSAKRHFQLSEVSEGTASEQNSQSRSQETFLNINIFHRSK
jgi:hypothetical protein